MFAILFISLTIAIIYLKFFNTHYGDQQITESEYNSYQIEGEYHYIEGTKTAELMIEELSK